MNKNAALSRIQYLAKEQPHLYQVIRDLIEEIATDAGEVKRGEKVRDAWE